MADNQPREYDPVLGGQTSPPVNGVVLGGIEGAKQSFASSNENYRILALSQLINYGQEGLELLTQSLKDPSKQVQIAAYKLLREISETRINQAIQEFNPYQFFECVHTFQKAYKYINESNIIVDGQTVISCFFQWNYDNADDTAMTRIKCIAWNLNQAWTSPVRNSKNISWLNSTKFIPLKRFIRMYDYHLHSLLICPDAQTLIVAGTEYSRTGDTRIDVLNLQTGEFIHTLYGHLKWGTDKEVILAASQDGKILVTGSEDKTAIIWDLNKGQKLYTLEGNYGAVTSLAISPNGETLASGSADRTIKVWNLNTGCEILNLTRHPYPVVALAISPDGETLVSGCSDGTIKVWFLPTGEENFTINVHSRIILSLAITPDGQNLISSSRDSTTIKVWDLQTGREKAILNGHTGVVSSVAISADGQTLISGSVDGTIKIWRMP
ncbi:MAG: WD40 repeat domain-containing protein [Nostoc sp.]|uniref:WD40 repeat domain-containing protein n=1 Tax=Nostoc sp. TaxID=1180 RepID=UPI002FFC0068